jgi:16S rRNA (uracil1498-N3)-methyltransferase
MTQRFFVQPDAIAQGAVTFVGPQAHQMISVLRMRPADRCFVLDNSGWQYEVELADLRPGEVRAKVLSRSLVTTEPRTKVTLYQAVLKADRFEHVLQKGTELGVVAFVPTICDRCVVGSFEDGRSGKLIRWERIIAEAAEQSGRGKLPVLQPGTIFRQACSQARGISLIPDEQEGSRRLREALRQLTTNAAVETRNARPRPFAVNLFIGPEGGFAEEEIEVARGYGIVPVSLGSRILRSETAAIAAASAVLYELGDLG